MHHPIRLVVDDDLRRSRLTVFFRLILALPQLAWAQVWTVLMLVGALPLGWLVTLFAGRLWPELHELSARLRAGIDLDRALRLSAELEDAETIRKLELRK